MKQTSKILSRFERTRLIGTRAVQIAMNSPPVIDTKGETDALKIAQMEFEQKKIPLKVIRELPNGIIEEWSINEFYII
jgi:DNA-directed RNA polymerase I, II, and III subunit RPABC2